MSALQLAKKAVRSEARIKLKSLSTAQKLVESNTVSKKVCQHAAYKSSKRVAVYLHMNEEVETTSIIKDIFESGRQCFIPRFTVDTMDMYRMNSLEDISNLPRGKWGIAQPEDIDRLESALESELGIDLIVTPGLGFDLGGGRIGRGKGYYDRFFSKLQTNMKGVGKTPYTIGVGFSVQKFEKIPCETTDVMLDAVMFADDDATLTPVNYNTNTTTTTTNDDTNAHTDKL